MYEANFELNPSGFTPLSGLYELETDLEGSLRVTVINKDGDGEDLVHHYPQNSKNHSIPILGLFFNHTNEVIIDFVVDNVILNHDTLNIQTEVGPDYFPEVLIDVAEKDRMEPGMNFINYRSKSNPTVMFAMDTEGEVRYLLDFTGHPDLEQLNYDVGPERMRNGDLLFGWTPRNLVYQVDILGNIKKDWFMNNHTFHHTASERENGNILVTANKYESIHPSGLESIEDFIIELDHNTGELVNEWDLKESIDPLRDILGNSQSFQIDWAHENGVIEDPSDNSIIVSCRFQGVIKLSQDNEPIWLLSNHQDWGLNASGLDLNEKLLQPLDAQGHAITDTDVLNGTSNHPDFEWPWYQHAPSLDSDGNLWIFDNGDLRNFSIDEKYSRAVCYKIDEENMTVQQLWTYGKERGIETYSRITSDVDVEEVTGNILFCPGTRVDNGVGEGSKIVEIDFDTKEVVFEMRIISSGISFHRAERMPLYFNQ